METWINLVYINFDFVFLNIHDRSPDLQNLQYVSFCDPHFYVKVECVKNCSDFVQNFSTYMQVITVPTY